MKKRYLQDTSGVYLAYYDTRIDHVKEPQVGDLVFLGPPGDQHVGFYGIDDEGRNLLIHSAPKITVGGEMYEAGPRENVLIGWTNRDANDEYTNMLVRNRYFTKWEDQFNTGYNFGRIKPWWKTSDFAGR